MAMTYQNFASLGVNLNRQKYGPLDISNVFTSAADLKYYLTKGTFTEGVSEYWYKSANEKVVPYPYEGQVLATVIDGVVSVYALALDAEGNFTTQEIGAKIETDDKTIKLVDGKLQLVGLPANTAGKTYVPSYVNGVLTWAEPDTSTAEGQAQEIEGLKTRATALEAAVNGTGEGDEHVAGLVEKVAALEAVDNATQAELDAYKEVVTKAITDAVTEVKKYADDNDADTVYDDTALSNRVKALEDKPAYDETPLSNRVTALETTVGTAEAGLVKDVADEKARAEAAEKSLGERIDGIDFIDQDELDAAIQPITTEIATKAAQSDLEALEDRVDAFLTGTGATDALDSLQELIEYINTHDDTDINGIIASIEAIEKKLEGVDSTVAAYVTAAIDALKIEDYAKAADLTALAERVEALEAKPFDDYATTSEVEAVDAKFADYTKTSDLNTTLAGKVNTSDFETFKGENTTAIGAAKDAAIAAAKTETETQVGALEDRVATTYATKTELGEAVEGIENDLLGYVTNDTLETELAKKADASSVYTKTEVDAKIGVPGVPAVTDEEGNEITPAVQGTGVFANAYSRAEVDKLLDEVQGGSSASADSVLRQLNTYKSTNDERVSNIETKNGEQDVAIATAQAKADQGFANAAQVASDLAALDARVVSNTNEIAATKDTIATVNETLSGKIAALETTDTEVAELISNLDTTVKAHGTSLEGHTSAIEALQTRDTEIAALIQANTDNFAKYSTTDQMNAAIAAAITGADLDTYAKKTDVQAVVDDLAAEVARATAAEEANADAIAVLVGTVEGDNTKSIRTIAAEETAKIVAGADTKYDTLKEIADFIMNDETGAAAMSNDIADLKTAVADHDTAIKAIIQPKASTEVTVADDGTLGLGEVSTDKLVQGTLELIINGGSATTDSDK